MNCSSGMCKKCHGAHHIVLGALLLLNAFVWPQWTDLTGWISFVAVLMVIGGLLKLLHPSCGHCETSSKKKGKK
ncbi:hypothetical protein HOD05_03530 [Candidatus Woesearchaeota archaeon]|jgi:hypothetical protein|nr:hypothetical protein [Candidatus Woesearchaeota archaeon]MBT4150624.1 hypothetical protein [Candidatus Woesearchaeota archaeon]MBT4247842.1 hypothetical protein [Candidatus Woesearchaeota archaeon]MBT4434266.1 hypothetical protein [Candidatus Woesearchaeota archaeon]MBT7331813.1 hypothetical protein [Candidatus Woesearchaeota archaeon]